MTKNPIAQRRKSLQQCQDDWKVRFKAAYKENLLSATIVGLCTIAGAVYALQGQIGLNPALAMGALMLMAIPVLMLGPAFASVGTYPTAAQHAKTNLVIDMHDEMKRQALGTSSSKPQITRG